MTMAQFTTSLVLAAACSAAVGAPAQAKIILRHAGVRGSSYGRAQLSADRAQMRSHAGGAKAAHSDLPPPVHR